MGEHLFIKVQNLRNNSHKTVKYTPSNELLPNDMAFFSRHTFLKSRGASLASNDGQTAAFMP
jgi:hypothetical protein